ncbi:MAG TPA: NnrS family protein [Rhodospirillaceae bacterium]|nr:NnrS family protein [Rhodospirillaceae bacterium]
MSSSHNVSPSPSGLPLWQAGFRPFFLLAGLQAVLQIPFWLAQVSGGLSLGLTYSPWLWHGHEMLFGFGGAALAGFLLTAVGNWTGLPTPTGKPLKLLVAFWLAARLAFALAGWLPAWVAGLADLPFFPLLGFMVGRPLLRANQRRNLVALVVLAGLWLADLLILAEMSGIAALALHGLALALFLLVFMIGVIGGRIIPAFTQSGLRSLGIERPQVSRPGLDRLAIGLLATVVLAEAGAPGSPFAGVLCLAAAAAHLTRLVGWRGWLAWRLPLLWVLHLGYLWLPLGLVLVGLAALWPSLLSFELALHGLSAGAIGLMILAVMSRAALGHSGRPLIPTNATIFAYLLVWSGAGLRILGPLVDPEIGLWASGLAWSGGFALFVMVYAPICWSPRADGKPG